MKNAKLKSMLITTSICALVFTGCNSRMQNSTKSPIITKPPTIVNNKNNTSNSMTGTSDQIIQTDQTAIRSIYSQTLKGLVTARTITQAQSDKVLPVITRNMSQGQVVTNNQGQVVTNNQGQVVTNNQGQVVTNNQGQMGTVTQDQIGMNNQGQMGTPSQNQTGINNQGQTGTANDTSNGRSSNMNGLTSLVESNVITQTQANKINQKIQAALRNMQTNR